MALMNEIISYQFLDKEVKKITPLFHCDYQPSLSTDHANMRKNDWIKMLKFPVHSPALLQKRVYYFIQTLTRSVLRKSDSSGNE